MFEAILVKLWPYSGFDSYAWPNVLSIYGSVGVILVVQTNFHKNHLIPMSDT